VPAGTAAGRLLRALAPVLRRFGDRWYLFGAQAAIVRGRPRLTGDVDVTAFLEPEAPEAFVAVMSPAGFALRVTDVDGFVERTRAPEGYRGRARHPPGAGSVVRRRPHP
jgi:hypothetical protein